MVPDRREEEAEQARVERGVYLEALLIVDELRAVARTGRLTDVQRRFLEAAKKAVVDHEAAEEQERRWRAKWRARFP